MKLEFQDYHLPVILAALEAFQRFRINQPKTALEEIFPKECWKLGWGKMAEICQPFHDAFFPDHPTNGGPSICSERAGKEAHLAYEIKKTIEQYLALKKSNGWFGNTADFDGNLLNPSGNPPPKIEGLAEMQYKDFKIPDQAAAANFYDQKDYAKLWNLVKDTMPDLPSGDKLEIIRKYVEETPAAIDYAESLNVRVHKPRKKIV
ncbi:MAG: hypothetical protein FMNOHCHN_01606 [Ignavibacteriaceae bacterium]|nr:hypothetical protein [Ignavibacteriaceae bacterium]